jgi:hypothetical protein
MKLYSDILKGKEMDQSEIPMETVQGISAASGYGLDLIPAPAIERDGNCAIELVMDQMKRYVYYLNYRKNNLDIFHSLDHALRTTSVPTHWRTE